MKELCNIDKTGLTVHVDNKLSLPFQTVFIPTWLLLILSASIVIASVKNSDDNIRLLLNNLKGIKNRKAKFVTVITLIFKGQVHQFHGKVAGVITETVSGEKGFGYDPIFMPDGWRKTFAEVDLVQKNEISHRAIAVSKLVDFLKKNG